MTNPIVASLGNLRKAMPYSIRFTHQTTGQGRLEIPDEQQNVDMHSHQLEAGRSYRVRLDPDPHNRAYVRMYVRRDDSNTETYGPYVMLDSAGYAESDEVVVSVAPGERVLLRVHAGTNSLYLPRTSASMTITPTPAWSPPTEISTGATNVSYTVNFLGPGSGGFLEMPVSQRGSSSTHHPLQPGSYSITATYAGTQSPTVTVTDHLGVETTLVFGAPQGGVTQATPLPVWIGDGGNPTIRVYGGADTGVTVTVRPHNTYQGG